jgi:hypothetical protein
MGLFRTNKKTAYRVALYSHLKQQLRYMETHGTNNAHIAIYISEAIACFHENNIARVKNKTKLKVLIRFLNNYGIVASDFYEGHYKYI